MVKGAVHLHFLETTDGRKQCVYCLWEAKQNITRMKWHLQRCRKCPENIREYFKKLRKGTHSNSYNEDILKVEAEEESPDVSLEMENNLKPVLFVNEESSVSAIANEIPGDKYENIQKEMANEPIPNHSLTKKNVTNNSTPETFEMNFISSEKHIDKTLPTVGGKRKLTSESDNATSGIKVDIKNEILVYQHKNIILQNYKMQLETLKLERELGMPRSEHTKNLPKQNL